MPPTPKVLLPFVLFTVEESVLYQYCSPGCRSSPKLCILNRLAILFLMLGSSPSVLSEFSVVVQNRWVWAL